MNEILVMISAFSGILFGYMLGRIAPEEVGPGRKWLVLSRNVDLRGNGVDELR